MTIMALNIAAGTWAVKYNNQTLEGIEAAEPSLDQETTDITTIAGQKITKVTSRSAEIVLTAVDTGIDNLKNFLPDAWIAAGTQVDGQPATTVATTGGKGLITYGAPACGEVALTAPLQLIPCENPDEHTVTLYDGVAEMTDLQLEDGVLKVEVTIRSQAVGVQLTKGGVTFAS